MPQQFRAKALRPQGHRIEPRRTSPRLRGYDSKWDRYSLQYRRQNPFCARHQEVGQDVLIVAGNTGVVDHKWPVADGGPMWDKGNHWGLCTSCHSGWKARLEQLARETGQVNLLIQWCDDPQIRPRFRGEALPVSPGGAVVAC